MAETAAVTAASPPAPPATAFPTSSAPNTPSPLSGPPPSITHRIFHPPKLERKHSSGDLHSRLKTRKILGVGETDNGDIHRSKISQLLGHNEHLYVKFPRGFWVWHLFNTIVFTLQALVSLVFPDRAFTFLSLLAPNSESTTLFATRLHGAALLALALCLWTVIPKIQCSYNVKSVSSFLWHFQGTTDKAQARCALMAIILYQLLQFFVCCLSMEGASWLTGDAVLSVSSQCVLLTVNLLYYQAIGKSTSGLRKSSSYKDLTAVTTPTAFADKRNGAAFAMMATNSFRKDKW